MSSLPERIERIERDLLAEPPRISAYHDLPFAVLHYTPAEEFEARRQIRRFATRLENAGRRVHPFSLARLLWRAVEATEGVAAIAQEERDLGFRRAQNTLCTLLSDDSFLPLRNQLAELTRPLDPEHDVVFLVRAAALAPAAYRCAKLLDELHGRTPVPMILFYPGTLEGTTNLRFMDLPEREQTGAYNYRVKIY